MKLDSPYSDSPQLSNIAHKSGGRHCGFKSDPLIPD